MNDQIRLQRLQYEYKRFSKAAGLRTENERAQVAGFGRGQAARAKTVHKKELNRLNEINSSGIMRYESNAFGFDGYTAEQYTEMLSRKATVSLSKETTSLPIDGGANSITDLIHSTGSVKQRRVYGPTGKAVIDYDTDDHGLPKQHPTGAHKHFFDYRKKKPRGGYVPLTTADLTLNSDIIREGENYHASKTDRPN